MASHIPGDSRLRRDRANTSVWLWDFIVQHTLHSTLRQSYKHVTLVIHRKTDKVRPGFQNFSHSRLFVKTSSLPCHLNLWDGPKRWQFNLALLPICQSTHHNSQISFSGFRRAECQLCICWGCGFCRLTCWRRPGSCSGCCSLVQWWDWIRRQAVIAQRLEPDHWLRLLCHKSGEEIRPGVKDVGHLF